jgi:3-deoxy-D-manno-octulosonic-acid transferase
MRFFYTLGTTIYGVLLNVATLFMAKAKLLVNGRSQTLKRIQDFNESRDSRDLIWIHCASLGEYEMAVPVIERIPKDTYSIALSFYSPSGFENVVNKSPADVTFYLPQDTPKKMQELLVALNPSSLILVKYDFWFNLLYLLNKRKTPFYVINGVFTEKHFFFSFWGQWALDILKKGAHFFVQNDSSKKQLHDHGISNVQVVKDIRYQRVLDRKKNVQLPERLQRFKGERPILILGSSWPEEEDILIQTLPLSDWKVIIAPHDVSANHIDQLRSKLLAKSELETVFWSDNKDSSNADILVLDTIGLLASAYSLADAALVGGGFSGKLHNTLEPAVYGIPLATGPIIQDFPEAIDLKNQGMLTCVKSDFDLTSFLGEAKKATVQERAQQVAKDTFIGLEIKLDEMVQVLLGKTI